MVVLSVVRACVVVLSVVVVVLVFSVVVVCARVQFWLVVRAWLCLYFLRLCARGCACAFFGCARVVVFVLSSVVLSVVRARVVVLVLSVVVVCARVQFWLVVRAWLCL